jgi:replication factor A1
MTPEEVLDDIAKKSNLPKTEIVERVNRKQKELSGLVSKEGAAYLVAHELGININENRKKLRLKDIMSGMRGVNAIGRIFRISNVIEFSKSDGSKGRVVNLFVGDSTNFIKLVLWDTQVKLIEDEVVKLGDVIEISNGYGRENQFGDTEITLGKFGNIKPSEEEIMPTTEELSKKFLSFSPQRVFIKDILPGMFEIRGIIVQLFKGNYTFDTCSVCGSKITEGKCEEHGEVEIKPALVLSFIVDDGSDSIRTVLFRDVAEKLLGISAKEIKAMGDQERFDAVKRALLGREVVVSGRVRKNTMFDRMEFVVNNLKEVNSKEESKTLIEEIQLKLGGLNSDLDF